MEHRSILVCENCRTPLSGQQKRWCPRCKPYAKRIYYREYNRKNAEKKRDVALRWLEVNKDRRNEIRRNRERNNREYYRIKGREQYRRHREKKIAKVARWAERHPKEYKEIAARYRKNNQDKLREYRNRRRSADALVEHSLTEEEWAETLLGTDRRCVYCGALWEHQDHFVPLKRGGGYTALNIVPSCAKCNREKGTKMPFMFIREKLANKKGRMR